MGEGLRRGKPQESSHYTQSKSLGADRLALFFRDNGFFARTGVVSRFPFALESRRMGDREANGQANCKVIFFTLPTRSETQRLNGHNVNPRFFRCVVVVHFLFLTRKEDFAVRLGKWRESLTRR